MTKQYKTGVIITGDATGAIRAVNSTDAELNKLNATKNTAKSRAKALGDEWGSAAKSVAKWGAAAAVAAAAGIAALVKSSINAADAAIKAAQGAGVSVESLTAMQYAADLAGVSNEQLAKGMGRLNRSISDAAKGLQTQSQAFADLGISVSDAQGNLRSADQVLLDVADKFSKYEDGAAKAAIAQEIFGRAGADLIPMLNQGADGITALMIEAEQLGLVIDTQTAQAAEKFNDSLTTMGKVGAGVGNRFMADMLPAMNSVSGLMLDYAKNSDVASTASTALGNVLKTLITVGIGIGTAFKAVGERIGAVAAAFMQAAKGDLTGAWKTIQQSNKDTADTVTDAIGKITKLWNGEYADAGEKAAETDKKMTEAKEVLTRQTKEMQDATKAAIKSEKDFIKEVEEAARELARARQEEEKLTAARRETLATARTAVDELQRQIAVVGKGEAAQFTLNKQLAIENALRSDAYKKLLPAQQKEYLELIAQQQDLTRTLENQQQAQQKVEEAAKAAAEETARVWQEATNRIDEAFANAWTGAFDSFKSFASALKDAFKNLLGNLAHMAITRPILISLGLGGSGSALAGGGSGSGAGGILSGISSLLGSNPLGGVGMALQDLALNNPMLSGLFDVGTNVASMSAMDLGLSALAGYAGNFIGSAIGKSLFNKQAESAWATTIGSIGGTLLGGPIGSLIGGTIGSIIDSAFGGDGKKRSILGVTTRPDQDKFNLVQNQITAESGLLLSTYTIRAGEQAQEYADNLAQAMAATDAVLVNLYRNLGTSVNLSGVGLDGKTPQVGTSEAANFFGASEYNRLAVEDVEGALDAFTDAWVAKVGELTKVVVDLDVFRALSQDGEALGDTIMRVQAELLVVNELFGALGISTYDFSVTGMAAADGLVQAAGGLDALASATNYYYQNVYTEQERAEQALERYSATIAAFNEQFGTAIASTDDLRTYVDALAASENWASAATQQAYVAALNLTPALVGQADAMKLLAPVIDDVTDAVNGLLSAGQLNTLKDISQTIFDGYQTREAELADLQKQLAKINGEIADLTSNTEDVFEPIPAAIDNIASSVDTLTLSSSQLRSQADAIRNTIASLSLGATSYLTNKQQLDFAQQQFQAAQREYQASGDASGLSSAATAYQQEIAQYYAGSDTGRALSDGIIEYLQTAGADLDTQAAAAERAERIAEAQRAALDNISRTQTTALEVTQENARLDQLYQQRQLIEQQIANLTATDSLAIMEAQLGHLVDITTGVSTLNDLLGYLPTSIADGIAAALGVAITDYRALTDAEAFFNGLGSAGIPSYDVGTPFVTHNQTANIHRGEMIIDPASSAALRKYGINVSSDNSGNSTNNTEVVAKLDTLITRIESLERTTGTGFVRAEGQRERQIDTATATPAEIARQLNPLDVVGARR